MKTPKYDVLLPTLFVSVIFPAAAGGWWRFFSGHADQIANPMVHSQSAVLAILEEEESQGRNSALVAHPIGHRSTIAISSHHIVLTKSVPTPVIDELLPDRSLVNDGPYDK